MVLWTQRVLFICFPSLFVEELYDICQSAYILSTQLGEFLQIEHLCKQHPAEETGQENRREGLSPAPVGDALPVNEHSNYSISHKRGKKYLVKEIGNLYVIFFLYLSVDLTF